MRRSSFATMVRGVAGTKTAIAALVMLTITATVTAVPLQVQVGSTGAYYDYQATVVSGPVGIYNVNDTFRTFCLERDERSLNGATYNIVLDDKSIDGGVGPAGDPLDTRTAFLYSEFLAGNLGSFGIGNDAASYTVMQNAIWKIEDEGSVINVDDLVAYATANANGSNYNIKVMVMYTATGELAQDMLVVVPEPVTIAILGLGGLMLARKRK